MSSQKAFEFIPAFLQDFQVCGEFTAAMIVTIKVFPALFAFKHGDDRFALHAIQTDGGNVDSESRSRGANLHCAATETTVIGPKECLLLQASVHLRFAGGHELFLEENIQEASGIEATGIV